MSSSDKSGSNNPIPVKDAPRLASAISEGKSILKECGSKASAARHIFELIHDEHRDIILKAFIEGADVTPKGAPTYYYNISRKFKRRNTAVSAG
jgi:bisphosphoglycerate-independent phosphoglycerate mutase (AlkP superfamily)